MSLPRIGILTVSDRVSRGEYADRSGPAVRAFLEERLDGDWETLERVVADERAEIEDELLELADRQSCCLVITTGGTGPGARDVTPEATAAVCDRELPGIGERMRAASVATVPTAVLSRQTAGLRGSCLLVNLPGNPKAIRQCLDTVFAALPHAIRLAGGPGLELVSPPDLPH